MNKLTLFIWLIFINLTLLYGCQENSYKEEKNNKSEKVSKKKSKIKEKEEYEIFVMDTSYTFEYFISEDTEKYVLENSITDNFIFPSGKELKISSPFIVFENDKAIYGPIESYPHSDSLIKTRDTLYIFRKVYFEKEEDFFVVKFYEENDKVQIKNTLIYQPNISIEKQQELIQLFEEIVALKQSPEENFNFLLSKNKSNAYPLDILFSYPKELLICALLGNKKCEQILMNLREVVSYDGAPGQECTTMQRIYYDFKTFEK